MRRLLLIAFTLVTVPPPHAGASLSLSPVLPAFLTSGDVASIGVTVANSGADSDVVVSMLSLDPGALRFDDSSSQLVHVASGSSVTVPFIAAARNAGTAHIRITASIGRDAVSAISIDAAQTIVRLSALETIAASGDTVDRAAARVDLPRDIDTSSGGLTITLGSSPLVELGESIRWLDELPYDSAEHASSRALALVIAAELNDGIDVAGATPADVRARAAAAVQNLARYQCPNGGFTSWASGCADASAILTTAALHAMKRGGVLGLTTDQAAIDRALDYLSQPHDAEPADATWLAWAVSRAYTVRTLAEFTRPVDADISQLIGAVDRLPAVALSALADALVSTNDRGPRYQDVTRRLIAALQVNGNHAHIESADTGSRAWLWQSDVGATATVLEGLVRRKDTAASAPALAAWLLAARVNERWVTSQDNAAALESLVAYDRAFVTNTSSVSANVTLGSSTVGKAAFNGRTITPHTFTIPMPELVKLIAANPARDFIVARSGAGRVFYETRLQYATLSPPEAAEHGVRLTRRYEHVASDGTTVLPMDASFALGDFIRVTLSITLADEGAYIAIVDPLPAGVNVVDSAFQSMIADATRAGSDTAAAAESPTRRDGFDHLEQHAADVTAFATRLTAGTHEWSYLVRAATSGRFTAGGAHAESMVQPNMNGRTAVTTLTIK